MDSDAVVKFYQNHSQAETSKAFNISKYSIGKIAKEKNFSKKAYKENLGREIAESYRASNIWGAKDIAEVYDVTEGAVRYAIKKYGGRIKPGSEVLEREYISPENSETRKPRFWKRMTDSCKYGVAAAAAGLLLTTGALWYTTGCSKHNEQAPRQKQAQLEQKVVEVPVKEIVSETKSDTMKFKDYDTDKDRKKDITEVIAPSAGAAEAPQYKLAPAPKPELAKVDETPKPVPKYEAPKPKVAETPKPAVQPQKTLEKDLIEAELANAKKDIDDNKAKNIENLKKKIKQSYDPDSGFYGQAGVFLGDKTSAPLELGYKTKDWGIAGFAESGEYGLKAGLFDVSDYSIDATLAEYGGDAKGLGLMFGKDFIFGKEKDWNLRPEVGAYNFKAGKEKASGANANLMLQKKVGNWVFSAGVNANSDENVGKLGGLFTISYGTGLGNQMTHISGLGGLEDRLIEGNYPDGSTGQGGTGGGAGGGGDGNGGPGPNPNPGDVSPGVPPVTNPPNPSGNPGVPPVTDPSNPNGNPTIPPEVPPTAP